MDWLDEAAAGTYIPLLNVFNELVEEGLSPKVTLGVTPILTEMLANPIFQNNLGHYLNNKIDIAKDNAKEFHRTGEREMENIAHMWESWYQDRLDDFNDKYSRDLVGAFRKLQDDGHVELITCAATHGYLPLLGEDISINAQIKTAIRTHERHFEKRPNGIWLPECAYRPSYAWASPLDDNPEPKLRRGIESFLSENDLRFFFADSHLLQGGEAIGVYIDRFGALRRIWSQFEKEYNPTPVDIEKTPYHPYLVNPEQGQDPVTVLTRDPVTGIQVWSGEHGYPGNSDFLDFHKKYSEGGLRYWRVTSQKMDMADKELYVPDWALGHIQPQADHFSGLVHETLANHCSETNSSGILCAPFDTELFGHWWWEGPVWLKAVLKSLAQSEHVNLTTASEYLEEHPASVIVSLPEGSWGKGGFHYIWLNEDTKWTWKHVYETEKEMIELAGSLCESHNGDVQRVLKQAARELLLLQSSDWQFLISTWSARDYAEIRFDYHYHAFKKLAALARKLADDGTMPDEDWTFVQECEAKDAVFPDIDVSWWKESDT